MNAPVPNTQFAKSGESLTQGLVQLIRSKPVDDDDLRAASLFVLDTIACALASRGTEPHRMLNAIVPEGADVARRAFFFGGLAHVVEMDDLHRASVTHPGSVVVPAAWALAEHLDLSGRDFLEAVLRGYEACARVGMAVGRKHYEIWHNTGTCGPFGSAMAAALLLGLDEERTAWALGNAGTQSCGPWQFLETGAMSKHLHTARGAEAGVIAALLADEGFTGPPAILEGEKGLFRGFCPDPRPQALLAEPDAPWQLHLTSIKPWPCCRHTHPTIDAALEIAGRIDGTPIRSIDVATYRAALDVCDRPEPADAYSAKFSLQHCAAIAIVDGAVGLDSFDAEARERVGAVRAVTRVSVDRAVDAAYPAAWGARLRVETEDGREIEARRDAAKGDPDAPLSDEELVEKARGLIGAGREAETLIAATLALAGDGRPMDLGLEKILRPAS